MQSAAAGLDDPAELVEALEREAEKVSYRAVAPSDPTRGVVDRLLVDAGMAAYPDQVGRIKTQVRVPVVDRATRQYARLSELVARALIVEAALARDDVLGTWRPPADPFFNPSGKGPAVPAGDVVRTIGDLINVLAGLAGSSHAAHESIVRLTE